jgi:hypothetical protein
MLRNVNILDLLQKSIFAPQPPNLGENTFKVPRIGGCEGAFRIICKRSIGNPYQ